MLACACLIKRENFNVIASEKPDFNLAEIEQWVEEHESGYFIRDDNSVFDCKYLDPVVFSAIYVFSNQDKDALFREITKK